MFTAPPCAALPSGTRLRAPPPTRQSGGCSRRQTRSRAACRLQRRRCRPRCCAAAAPAGSAPACRCGTHAVLVIKIAWLDGLPGALMCVCIQGCRSLCAVAAANTRGAACDCHMPEQSSHDSAGHAEQRIAADLPNASSFSASTPAWNITSCGRCSCHSRGSQSFNACRA